MRHTFAEHLMVLPVPMRVTAAGQVLFEQQACNGLDRWADSFQTLLVACPVLPESLVASRKAMAWMPIESIPSAARIEMVPLPWARTLASFMRHYRATRGLLRSLIDRSRYLHFGIGGLWGDWAGVACEVAHAADRPYATHTDRVEDAFVRRTAEQKSLSRRLKSHAMAGMMRRCHHRWIRNASLVMCHGFDTFEAYRHLNSNAHVIHNIHTTAEDQATPEQVEAKAADVLDARRPLRVIYAGRADAPKAPLDWVKAIADAVQRGANVGATWLGDGALRDAMEKEIDRTGLRDRVTIAGFISDRAQVLRELRAADVFLFCHITPESPRCLIEALISATPIVGYTSHYAADLISRHGGGELTPLGNPSALGETLNRLANDRVPLARLIRAARRDGDRFTSAAVFRERSELIRRYLSDHPFPTTQAAAMAAGEGTT